MCSHKICGEKIRNQVTAEVFFFDPKANLDFALKIY